MEEINSFRGQFIFLSNMHACTVTRKGIVFPSSEHAYVAAKAALNDDGSLPLDFWKEIAAIETPGKAKRFGRMVLAGFSLVAPRSRRSPWKSFRLLWKASGLLR